MPIDFLWEPGEQEEMNSALAGLSQKISDMGIGTDSQGNLIATGGQAKEAEASKNFESAAADKSALQRTASSMDEMVRRGLFQSSVKDTELFDIEAAKAMRKTFLDTNFKTSLAGLNRAKSGFENDAAGIRNTGLAKARARAIGWNSSPDNPENAAAPAAPAATPEAARSAGWTEYSSQIEAGGVPIKTDTQGRKYRVLKREGGGYTRVYV